MDRLRAEMNTLLRVAEPAKLPMLVRVGRTSQPALSPRRDLSAITQPRLDRRQAYPATAVLAAKTSAVSGPELGANLGMRTVAANRVAHGGVGLILAPNASHRCPRT